MWEWKTPYRSHPIFEQLLATVTSPNASQLSIDSSLRTGNDSKLDNMAEYKDRGLANPVPQAESMYNKQ